MVFTLTAAMLIGTPLSASAAGLVDIYKTEDGWGIRYLAVTTTPVPEQ